MLWFNELIRKFRNFPLNNESLDEVIVIFEDLFEQYNEKDNFFSSLESSTCEDADASLALIQLKEIEKVKIDTLIKEIRNDLKYNFFSSLLQKKENLELIKKLKELLIKFEKKIVEQNQELLYLEKNKLLIIEESKIDNNGITNVKNFFNFLNERIINDAFLLKEINLNAFENKKNFLKKIWELKSETNQEIEGLNQKNKELENQGKKVFEKLFKEEIITQFILSFWAFRVKNNNNEYTIDLEDRDLKNETNKFDENFAFSFKLIDDVFDKYLKRIIKNEEKICTNIFQKFSDQKKNFESEQKESIKNKEENEENIKKFQEILEEQNQEVIKYQKEIEAKIKQVNDLKKRKKNIENKKNTYLEDWELNKNNFENQILIEKDLDRKKAKKQYLNKLKELIKEIEESIKKKNNDITELEDNILRYKTELSINNNRIKKSEETIDKIRTFFEQNKHVMLFELKKIKEKWIKKVAKNQKDFIEFLKKNNKLEDTKFIECLENCWRVNENEILLFNEKFNIKNNLQVIKEENEKIENKFKDDFKVLEVDFKLREKKIIESATKIIANNFHKSLRKINQSKIKNIETQTEINPEEGKTNWLEQKLDEQNKTNKKLEFQIKFCEEKLISIKELHEDEIKDLVVILEKIGFLLITGKKEIEEECEKLKNSLNARIQKKEKEIKIQLNELEIKLASLNELLSKISNEIPSSYFSFLTESQDKKESNWYEINLDNVSKQNLQVKQKNNL